MNQPLKAGDHKVKIMEQMAGLSRLLGMVPKDGSVIVENPSTQASLELAEWFEQARHSFLNLSVLVGRALDLELQ